MQVECPAPKLPAVAAHTWSACTRQPTQPKHCLFAHNRSIVFSTPVQERCAPLGIAPLARNVAAVHEQVQVAVQRARKQLAHKPVNWKAVGDGCEAGCMQPAT